MPLLPPSTVSPNAVAPRPESDARRTKRGCDGGGPVNVFSGASSWAEYPNELSVERKEEDDDSTRVAPAIEGDTFPDDFRVSSSRWGTSGDTEPMALDADCSMARSAEGIVLGSSRSCANCC
jgi:hypothetical protein